MASVSTSAGVAVPCPQCGALLAPPHQVETFSCPWCGSTLRPGDGPRLFHLTERPRLSRLEASQAVRRWFSGPDMPADLEESAQADVGALQVCPFVRLRGPGVERVAPLAPLPVPDLLDLPSVPADMVGATGIAGGEPAAGSLLRSEPVREAVRAAARDRSVKELVVEERAYYPVAYRYAGGHFTAVVAAGAGTVLAQRRPVRVQVVGERLLAVGVLGLLFTEAVLVPGMTAKLAVVGLTVAGLYPTVRWLVAARL